MKKRNNSYYLMGNELISIKDILSNDLGRNFIYNTRKILDFLSSIFVYDNVPDTIDPIFMDLTLMLNGTICCFLSNKDEILIGQGSYAGDLNAYGIGTEYIYTILNGYDSGQKKIANQNINVDLSSKNSKTHLIVGRNDRLFTSMISFVEKYSNLLSESQTTTLTRIIQARMQASVIGAMDSQEKENIDSAIEKVRSGDPAVVVRKPGIGERQEPFQLFHLLDTTKEIDNLQTIMMSEEEVLNMMLRELGISLNTKMKKSQINSAEFDGYERYSQVWIKNMLEQREFFCKSMNEFFGTNISVKINDLFLERSEENDTDVKRSLDGEE